MQDLTVTLIQSDLHWQQPDANLAMFEEKIWSNKKATDLIILPEMFTTGFTMEASLMAEPMGTRTFKWMQMQAEQTGAAITGSYIVKEKGLFFNRLMWVTPDGKFDFYDKRHLFRMADEHKTYQEGHARPIIKWKGWNIFPQICYDLRFPVWSRNREQQGALEYDLVIYVANWPAPRISAWDVLLRARAIENASYCIGLNRIGKDGVDIDYLGHSTVVDPKGNVLLHEENNEVVKTIELDYESLHQYREKFPVHLDADQFNIS